MNDELKGLVRKCWAEKPSKRPEIGEVINSLESLLLGLASH
jgi:hypothetical protein